MENVLDHKKILATTLLGLLALGCLSFLGYLYGDWEPVFFGLIVICVALLGAIQPRYVFYAILAEMMVGSTGRMLEIQFGGFDLSLRMALFGLALLFGIVAWIQNPDARLWRRAPRPNWRFEFLTLGTLFAAVIGIGILNGIFQNHPFSNVFLDVNNYFFYALILVIPVFVHLKKYIAEMLAVVIAGLSALWVKTVTLFLIFSHRLADLDSLYRWTRENRVAEVTIQDGGWVRVFFQSHIFALLLFFVAIFVLAHLWKKQTTEKWLWAWVTFISMFMLILSFSRSFWAAGIVTLAVALLSGRWTRVNWRSSMRMAGISLGSFVVAFLVIFALIQIPFPSSPDLSVDSISDRATELEGEAALGSRFKLLPPLTEKILSAPLIGTGFGTTVTYETLDPRYIDVTGETTYTTFTFEWGYLDTLTEIGVIGLTVYLFFLGVIGIRLWVAIRDQEDALTRALLLGLFFSGVALLITHGVTPYLNHPLGILWVILLASITVLWKPDYTVSLKADK